MKKIIMCICIISLTCGAGTDVFAAPTIQEIVSGATKATLDKARTFGSGIELTSTTVVNSNIKTTPSPTGTAGMNVMYTLSSMRAQAELYFNTNNNSYGPATQSCTGGIFKDTNSGLGNLLAEVRGFTKEINCASTATSYAVSAKASNGIYWCIDSRGNSKGLSKILKKGAVSCDAGTGLVAKTTKKTKTMTSVLSLFPKGNGIDMRSSLTTVVDGKSEQLVRIIRDGKSYILITNDIDTEAAPKNRRGMYVGRYLSMPKDSIISQFIGMTNDLNIFLDRLISGPKASLAVSRVNADRSTVYKLSMPYSSYAEVAGVFTGESFFTPISYDSNTPVHFFITIKDGYITALTANNAINGANNSYQSTITLKARTTPGGFLDPMPGTVVECSQYLEAEEAKELCTPIDLAQALSDAKEKGEAAAIQSILSNMRAQAELYYSNNNSYGPTARSCGEGIFADANVGGLGSLVTSMNSKSPSYSYCAADSKAWVVSTTLPTGGYYCVDSTGTAKMTSNRNENGDFACR